MVAVDLQRKTLMENSHTIRDYTLAKQEVTAAILEINRFLEEQNNGRRVDASHNLVEKLAEDRFNLAVVGQFKRGKSSLINAIIGRDLLPTGALPLTSAITALRYGPQDRALLKFKNWILEKEIPLQDLANYITERGNPGNEKNLLEARVELKNPFLRRGLYFVDTPGIGSMRQENTRTTYEYLPDADAIIFVTSADSPLGQAEVQFLSDIRQYIRKLFIIVNKIDLVPASEQPEVLGYIQTGVEKTLEITNIHLYPLSAQGGLEAKLHERPDQLSGSGLAGFEADLTAFLAEEKGKVFLVSILDRMLKLLHEDGVSIEDISSSPTAEADTLQMVVARMETLRAGLLEGVKITPLFPPKEKTELGQRILEEDITKSRSRPVFGYQGMLHSGQCPICLAQSKAIFDFFSSWQYDLTMKEEARVAFASLKGFCHTHTWQFQQLANAQGISEGYLLLLNDVGQKLHHWSGRDMSVEENSLDMILATVHSCPACQLVHTVEDNQVSAFLEQIQKPGALKVYASAPGLCVPHLISVLEGLEQPEIRKALINHQVERIEDLSDDLHSYLLKRSAVHRELINGDEAAAWKQTLLLLEGDPTVFSGQDC